MNFWVWCLHITLNLFLQFSSLALNFVHFLLPLNSRNTMSDIQKAMAMLIAAFHKYSGKEGDKTTLTKGELKELLTAELGDIFGETKDKTALEKIFKDLDANADGTVDFQEYVTLVACITMLCNEFFTKK
ncbi:ictacalcin-like [Sinocyclocheilus rhinocerous]|uniref:Protein S100 n=1 Tax=Sinocyclocheilus rhinocerous TaxID=307959 RepID=A0A673J9X7_9TELE|nr:PREDICTED: ictacalcin-like [Sinocyclocheilus rhinocerous]